METSCQVFTVISLKLFEILEEKRMLRCQKNTFFMFFFNIFLQQYIKTLSTLDAM